MRKVIIFIIFILLIIINTSFVLSAETKEECLGSLGYSGCWINEKCYEPAEFKTDEHGEKIWHEPLGYFYCVPEKDPESWTSSFIETENIGTPGIKYYYHCIDFDQDGECNFTSLGQLPDCPTKQFTGPCEHSTKDYPADPNDFSKFITTETTDYSGIGHCPNQYECDTPTFCEFAHGEEFKCNDDEYYYCAMEYERPSCRRVDYSKEHCESSGEFKWYDKIWFEQEKTWKTWCDIGPFEGTCLDYDKQYMSECKNETSCLSGNCEKYHKCFIISRATCLSPQSSEMSCKDLFKGSWDPNEEYCFKIPELRGYCPKKYQECKDNKHCADGSICEEGYYCGPAKSPDGTYICETPDYSEDHCKSAGGKWDLKKTECIIPAEEPDPEDELDPEEEPEENETLGKIGDCEIDKLMWTNKELIVLENATEDQELFLFIISTPESDCTNIFADFEIFDHENTSIESNVGDNDNQNMLLIEEGENRLWYAFTNWTTGNDVEYYFNATLTKDNLELIIKSYSIGIISEEEYNETLGDEEEETLNLINKNCMNLWDCSGAKWSECKDGIQTRDIDQCTWGGTDAQKNLCALPVSAKSCILEETEFQVFNWINLLIVSLMLISYYFINQRKNLDM